MSEMKITIASNPKELSRPYTHLQPIVDALISGGNTSVHAQVFFLDKDGWRCDLVRPIDFELIRKRFTLPDTISLSGNHDSILCENTWIEIQGSAQPGKKPALHVLEQR